MTGGARAVDVLIIPLLGRNGFAATAMACNLLVILSVDYRPITVVPFSQRKPKEEVMKKYMKPVVVGSGSVHPC